MKKYIFVMISVLTVLIFNSLLPGSAEAARVAVVPIRVNEAEVERVSDFNSYYWDVMVERFTYPDYELMEDAAVADILPDGELKSFDKKTLLDLAKKADAEIVVAMSVDKVYDRPLHFRNEDTLECHMQAEFASYNKITGKYYHKKLDYEEEIEEVLTYRSDWQRNAFVSELKRYLERTLEDKKAKKVF